MSIVKKWLMLVVEGHKNPHFFKRFLVSEISWEEREVYDTSSRDKKGKGDFVSKSQSENGDDALEQPPLFYDK